MAKKLRASNKRPGGVVTEEILEPAWLRYAVGSTLRQAATTIADTNKLTFSMGVQPAAAAGQYPLITIGDEGSPGFPGGNTTIILNMSGGGSGSITVNVESTATGATVTTEANGTEHLKGVFGFDSKTVALGDKFHLFISIDLSTYVSYSPSVPPSFEAPIAKLWINGVDCLDLTSNEFYPVNYTAGSYRAGSGVGTPLEATITPWSAAIVNAISGPTISIPNPNGDGAVNLSNIQVWCAQYIDPEGAASGAQVANSDDWIRDLVDGANGYGLDPLIMLTFANIESAYNPLSNRTNSTQYKGLFQFNAAEIQAAFTGLGLTRTPDLYKTTDQLDAYLWFYTTTRTQSGIVPWHGPVVSRGVADPTGLYHYLSHNQGPGGFNIVLNAVRDTPNRVISTFAPPTPHNLLNQAWMSAQWGTRITLASTISQWWTNLQNFYAAKRAQAQTKLTSGSKSNIEYFYKNGTMRIPSVGQSKFGVAEILFWGHKADIITGTTANNDGLASDFTAVNPDGITDVA